MARNKHREQKNDQQALAASGCKTSRDTAASFPENRHLELLAPGGSFDSVKAAFMAGADAVYMGGDRFSARAYAESAEEHSLEKAIDYAHLHGRQLYLTLNTLIKPGEMEQEVYDYVVPLYEQGLDGILVQDLGVLGMLRREFPDLPVHASTQMTVTDAAGARLLQSLGVTRVVASRELNLKELKSIYDATGMELEAFVHGAICYCYSGRCLYSSLVGGRSGNRGRCAQPCRLPYDLKSADGVNMSRKQESYLLSLKDMCTLEYLPRLAEAGVMSFKIEGRMKSPLYTAGIVSIYRKYLDHYLLKGGRDWKVDREDLDAVSEFFDRGGFTQYLTRHNGREMMALKEKPKLRKPDEMLMTATRERYLNKELKEDITGSVSICEDKNAVISLKTERCSATVVSTEPVQKSVNRPLSEKDVIKQMNKMGSTPFTLKKLQTELSDQAFMPVKQLNELRREAAEKLERKILDSFRRKAAVKETLTGDRALLSQQRRRADGTERGKNLPELHVSLLDPSMLDDVLKIPEVDLIETDVSGMSIEAISGIIQRVHDAGKKVFLKLPDIYRGKALEDLRLFAGLDSDGLTVSNLDELYALSGLKYDKSVICGHSVYVWNREAKAELEEISSLLGLKSVTTTAPYELNASELKALQPERMRLLVYGHMPMMVSANCLRKTEGCCTKQKGSRAVKEPLILTDRKQAHMPVFCNCRYCYNTIYNVLPTYLLDQSIKIREVDPYALLVSFTVERKEEAMRILNEAVRLEKSIREEASSAQEWKPAVENYTRGHWQRGVL